MFALSSIAVSDTNDWPPPEPIQKRVDQTVSIIDRLKSLVPEPATRMDDRAFELDFDSDAAVSYVRDEVAYDPYIGVLRGPEGTAIVSRGNAWDQAVFLASLLKSIGADTQIVAGTLPSADAARLLAQTFEVVPGKSDGAPDHAAIAAALGELDPEFAGGYRRQLANLSSEAAALALADATDSIAGALVDVLQGQGTGFELSKDADLLTRSIAEDYVWVRWRVGPGDEWVDVHPAFGNQAPPSPETESYIDSEIPQEHLHHVSLQLFIERGYADDPTVAERVAVMSAWKRPTANLHKEQVYIGMAPQQLGDSAASSFLVPVLNGGPAPGSQAVAQTGLIAPSGDTASLAGKLFATVSSKGNAAAGALGALGGNEPARERTLLGIILQLEVSSPAGTRTIERRVADLRGSPDDDFPVSGMFQMVLDVHVGPQTPAMVYHGMLDYQRPLVRAVPPMMAMARNNLSVQEMESSRTYAALGTPRWMDFELAAAGLLQPPSERSVTARSGPLLASRRTNSDSDGKLRTMIDILTNPSITLTRSTDGKIELDHSGSVSQGVRETLIESDLAGVEAGWSQRQPGTLITSADELSAEPYSAWPDQALETARSDLENGYLLAVVDNARSHWWRIDPASGETLGMSTEGGSEFTEYLVATAGVAISVALFAASVESCDEQYADDKEMADCCIVGNLIGTYATSAGSAIGSAATTTGNALYAASGSIGSALGWNAADIGTGLVIGKLDIVGGICSIGDEG